MTDVFSIFCASAPLRETCLNCGREAPALQSCLMPPMLAGFSLVDRLHLVTAASGSPLSRVAMFDELMSFLSRFITSFSACLPKLLHPYVIRPGLIVLLFTVVLASFLYREFGKEESEPLFDRSRQRPERYRLLTQFSLILTVLVVLLVSWTWYSMLNELQQAGDRVSRSQLTLAREARSTTFVALVVLNPIIYQVLVGLCMTVYTRQFLKLFVSMLTFGLLLYALLLTMFFCLFDHGPFGSVAVWTSTPDDARREHSPEVALWITALLGITCLWSVHWFARRLLVRRTQTTINSDRKAPALQA